MRSLSVTFRPRRSWNYGSLPPSLQDEGFFLCWTRKEALRQSKGRRIARPTQELSRHAHTRKACALADYGRSPLESAFAPPRRSVRGSSGRRRQRLEVALLEVEFIGRPLMRRGTTHVREIGCRTYRDRLPRAESDLCRKPSAASEVVVSV